MLGKPNNYIQRNDGQQSAWTLILSVMLPNECTGAVILSQK